MMLSQQYGRTRETYSPNCMFLSSGETTTIACLVTHCCRGRAESSSIQQSVSVCETNFDWQKSTSNIKRSCRFLSNADVTSFINRAVIRGFFADAYFSRSAAHQPIFLTLNHVVKSTSGRLTAAAGRLFGHRPILSCNDQIFGRCPGGVPAAIVQTPGGHRWESCRSPQDANESHSYLPFTYG